MICSRVVSWPEQVMVIREKLIATTGGDHQAFDIVATAREHQGHPHQDAGFIADVEGDGVQFVVQIMT